MSSSVPEGWSKSKLGEHVGVQGGNAFKSESFTDAGIPVIRISNIKKDGSVNLDSAIYTAPDESLSRFQVENGDILIAMSGATTGKVGRYSSNRYAYLNQRVGRFFVKRNSDANLDFIHQLTSEDGFVNSILIDAVGGAQPNISNQQIESIVVSNPPPPEQQKIATILSSVDDVIEKTQAQIDKLSDLKTGMMQELLTQGIGHTEFKDSPVGRIPVGWEVVELGRLADQVKPGPFGSSLTKSMYVESGYKVYGQEQVIAGDLSVGDYYIDQDKYDELSVFSVHADEILISLVGTFGQVVVVPYDFEEGVINPRLLKIRFPKESTNSIFFAHQLRSEFVLNQLNQLQQGGTMGVLSATTVKPVKLIVPPVDEQGKIADAITSVDSTRVIKQQQLASLNNSKKALMQDLLTGKVRVTVD